MKSLVTYLLYIPRWSLYVLFEVFKAIRPVKNKVLLIYQYAWQDFELLEVELKKSYPKTEAVTINDRKKSPIKYVFNQLKILWHMADSKGVLVDSFIAPVGLVRQRKDTVVVCVDHALGVVKKYGYVALNTAEGTTSLEAKITRLHQGIDYNCVGGKASIEYISSAKKIDKEKVLNIGLPRADYLQNKTIQRQAKRDILKKYPQLNNGKPIVLYSPTYRKNGSNAALDLIKTHDSASNNLVLTSHPLAKPLKNIPDGVIYAGNEDNFLDWIITMDVLITDYSSANLEAALLKKPVIFYLHDLDEYSKNRGLFFKFKDPDFPLPGPIINDPEKIWQFLKKPKYDKQKQNKFRRLYANPASKNCTKAIINLLKLPQ